MATAQWATAQRDMTTTTMVTATTTTTYNEGDGATDNNDDNDDDGDDTDGTVADDDDVDDVDDIDDDNLPPRVGKRNDGCDKTKTKKEETVGNTHNNQTDYREGGGRCRRLRQRRQ